MIKTFRHKGLREFFENGSKKGIKADHVKKLRLILIRLHVSTSPDDMNLPGFRLHPLKGDMQGLFAVDVSGNWRVTFRFDNGNAVNVDYIDYH